MMFFYFVAGIRFEKLWLYDNSLIIICCCFNCTKHRSACICLVHYGGTDKWETDRFTLWEGPLYEHSIIGLLQGALPIKDVPWSDWWNIQSSWQCWAMDDW
jgi:hypothetical protein